MELYLVRHAIAENRDPASWPDDRARPLTAEGTRSFKRAARGLRALVPEVQLVLSSRYVRAWQTALLLQREAGWPAPLECHALGEAPPEEVLAALQPHATLDRVALVGHEPHLHELASLLLTGAATRAHLEFKKGAVACLALDGVPQPGTATLRWLLPPRVLRQL